MRFFNQIKLQTPESVELEFTLAGIGNRTLALVIDNHILWLTYTLVLFVIVKLLEASSGAIDAVGADTEEIGELGKWLWAFFGLFSFAWFTGYFAVFETLWQGQTPGKRWTKIRVIANDGRSITPYQATLRALVRPLDDWLFIGFFMVLLGKGEKRLGDLVANTIVIQDSVAPIGSSKLPFSGRAQEIADRIQSQSDLSRLKPNDFAILKEYLQRRTGLEGNAREQVSQNLMQQFQTRLRLEAVEFTCPAEIFLEALYLAYEQQLGK
jgi:uncharacterized RDD family membrane protein YckC